MRDATSRALLFVLAAGVLGAAGPAAAQEEAPGEDELEFDEMVVAPPVVRWRSAGGGHLGVAIENVDPESAEEIGLSEVRGVRVTEVTEGSPAAEAGLRAGDVVVRFDGEEVRSTRQLVRLVRETPPGREVRVAVVRDGDERTLAATVGERSEAWPGLDAERMAEIRRQLERARERYGDAMEGLGDLDLRLEEGVLELDGDGAPAIAFGGRARLGVRLQNLTGQLAEYFGVEGGALVASVREGSPAAEAGLRAGDVIVRVDGEDLETQSGAARSEIARAVRQADAGPLPVTIVRDGEERMLTVELPAPDREDDAGG